MSSIRTRRRRIGEYRLFRCCLTVLRAGKGYRRPGEACETKHYLANLEYRVVYLSIAAASLEVRMQNKLFTPQLTDILGTKATRLRKVF